MRPHKVWQDWEAELRGLLEGVGIWQCRALALFSLGVALAKHCGLARAAAVVPGVALVPSITRRFERFLASERLDVVAVRSAVATRVLEAARADDLAGAGRDAPEGALVLGAPLHRVERHPVEQRDCHAAPSQCGEKHGPPARTDNGRTALAVPRTAHVDGTMNW